MPLDAVALSSAVYADHLSRYPDSAGVTRTNSDTGVSPHNPSEKFISALCTGLIETLGQIVINDIGAGTADVPGVPTPASFSFNTGLAKNYFLQTQGWKGKEANGVAVSFIVAPLRIFSQSAILMMAENLTMGTGIGVVNPVANVSLESAALGLLNTALPVAFQATGVFCRDDIPGQPLNQTLGDQLPVYAEALAKGIASISAEVVYTGTTTVPAPITGVSNSGGFL